MINKLMTAAATALLGAAGAAAQTEGATQPQQPDPGREAAMQAESRVLNLMRLSNQAEIRAAEIVLERTQSDTVRRFADRLLRDHRLGDDMVSSLAESKGIALLPASFDDETDGKTPAEAPGSPAPGDDASRSLESDAPSRQPMGQSPSLAPRAEEDAGESRRHAQEQAPSPDGWGLPQINEPPSSEEVNWQVSAPGQSEREQGDQADLPRPVPGETPRQPRDPTAREDPPPPPPTEGQAAERPLDLDITRIKAQRMLRELEAADDASLDSVYAAAMIKSHDEAVQKLRTGRQSVADADVEDLLAAFIPIIEQHGRLARHVQRELGGEAAPETDSETAPETEERR